MRFAFYWLLLSCSSVAFATRIFSYDHSKSSTIVSKCKGYPTGTPCRKNGELGVCKGNSCELSFHEDALLGESCRYHRCSGRNVVCRESVCKCKKGFANCDGNRRNGCETNTATSASHCGKCRKRIGANERCSNGKIVCRAAFVKCNGRCILGTTCGGTSNNEGGGGGFIPVYPPPPQGAMASPPSAPPPGGSSSGELNSLSPPPGSSSPPPPEQPSPSPQELLSPPPPQGAMTSPPSPTGGSDANQSPPPPPRIIPDPVVACGGRKCNGSCDCGGKNCHCMCLKGTTQLTCTASPIDYSCACKV